jgi:hypothetical protein
MALPFTPQDLEPANTGTFRTWTYKVGPTPDLGFDVAKLISPGAVAALGETFMIANAAHADWAMTQPEGRIDPRRAWRHEATDDRDIFRERHLPSPATVRVIVLVDASGSMSQADAHVEGREEPMSRNEASAVLAATMVEGLAFIPHVEIEVMQHSFGKTTSEGEEMGHSANGVHTVHLRRAWEEGTPIQFMNKMPSWGPGGGNADGHALVALTDWLDQDLLPDEVPMIIVVSDGAPADFGKNPDLRAIRAAHPEMVPYLDVADAALIDGVAYARQHGIKVLSVAIAGGDQGQFYGKDAVVRFDGNWTTLAQDLAAKIGEVVANEEHAVKDDPFDF